MSSILRVGKSADSTSIFENEEPWFIFLMLEDLNARGWICPSLGAFTSGLYLGPISDLASHTWPLLRGTVLPSPVARWGSSIWRRWESWPYLNMMWLGGLGICKYTAVPCTNRWFYWIMLWLHHLSKMWMEEEIKSKDPHPHLQQPDQLSDSNISKSNQLL